MSKRYQDIYPSAALLDSAQIIRRPSALALLTVEYFEAEPASMPHEVFSQHHILINLKDEPHRVENWRDDEHRDFIYHKYEIVVTPAGVKSGWHWHARSKVIVITLQPKQLEHFTQSELGVLLSDAQLKNLPQFMDEDISQAGLQLLEALKTETLGSQLMFESLARVFLVKLIQKYGQMRNDQPEFRKGFTAKHYKRVLELVSNRYGETITLEDMAREAGLSPHHFSRLFKETIGKSPMQYVTAHRIEAAKKLMANSTNPMIDVALCCGFADQAHFSRTFKQLEGITPKEYRHAK
jgi:AraC family transcriptional regulator